MPTPTDLDLMRAALGCDGLTDDWYDFYGVRKARSDGLTAPSRHKAGYSRDSFHNPASETAITLFMLANLDGWKQLKAFTERPRVAGKSWNPRFFEGLASAPPGPFDQPSLWSSHAGEGKLFGDDEVDFSRLILLIEVEAAGRAFRQVASRGSKGIELSFLKLTGLKKWAKFDAVLIDPTHRRFYLIEAKLGSDLSLETEKYPLVNQAVRSLEAGYWLTHHPASKYAGPEREWTFRFVFLCPRPLWEYRLRLYAHVLRTPDAVAEMLGHYRRLLIDNHAADLRLTGGEFDLHFDQFVAEAKDAVRVVHWDTLADAVAPAGSAFWDGYFQRVEAAYAQVRAADQARLATEAIRARLSAATGRR